MSSHYTRFLSSNFSTPMFLAHTSSWVLNKLSVFLAFSKIQYFFLFWQISALFHALLGKIWKMIRFMGIWDLKPKIKVCTGMFVSKSEIEYSVLSKSFLRKKISALLKRFQNRMSHDMHSFFVNKQHIIFLVFKLLMKMDGYLSPFWHTLIFFK